MCEFGSEIWVLGRLQWSPSLKNLVLMVFGDHFCDVEKWELPRKAFVLCTMIFFKTLGVKHETKEICEAW